MGWLAYAWGRTPLRFVRPSRLVQTTNMCMTTCCVLFCVGGRVRCVPVQLTRTGKTGLPFGSPYEYGAGHVDALAALNPGLGEL